MRKKWYLDINAKDCNYLLIRVKNLSKDTSGEVFFSTGSHPMSEEMKYSYTMKSAAKESGWQDIYIKLSGHPEWKGIIKELRIDSANSSGNFEFEKIELFKAEIK